MSMAELPIAIMGFNRPNYLQRVLTSLKTQQGVDLSRHKLLYFQDGSIDPYSGEERASQSDIERNIKIFKDNFPDGQVFSSESNLGVALNFERAEREVFDNLSAPAAIFLEDDLVLGPLYLKAMYEMLELASSHPEIGYVSVYGDHIASLDEQRRRSAEIALLGHNWAFALTQAQWRKSAPYVEQYLALVRGADYRKRPGQKIKDLFHSWGCGAPGTSQDVAKTLACFLTGGVKLNTVPAYGQYIGEIGLHTNPGLFAKMGFGETKVMEDELLLPHEITTEALVQVRKQLASYCNGEISSAPKPQADPPIRMTDAEVSLLTRYLRRSKFYLEFGCGGSTALAIRESKGMIVSVDSDATWISKLKQVATVQQAVSSGRLAGC
ncbi:hypothetical protein [Methylobacterium soli]|uniref:Uncharacterized protein n=1 Tax=Methylobacterium soli TaxID=553447 RepID=A0A6L3SPZ0_9HYPH|nr:hypothetical protein [Methylobacterium soli]KAB1072386.1 hypothetical protein F6X53_28305 [Methylobacterium soli]GJE44713.1 hypothetical protein AEGHOMDF_3903 [Methylobacterium soli]